MRRWLERPGYLAAALLLGGTTVVAVVVIVLVFARGDSDGGDEQVVATATAGESPPLTPAGSATATPTTESGPTATVAGSQDPDEALLALVRDRLGSELLSDCPLELPPGEEPPQGICALELYRSEELVTFMLGHPFSEAIGEAVITRNEDGSWSVQFIQAPPLGEPVRVGIEAMVFGAGDCLNFRSEPSLAAEPLWCLLDGTKGQVVEGPQQADDHTWWRLQDLGWASEMYLAPVPD